MTNVRGTHNPGGRRRLAGVRESSAARRARLRLLFALEVFGKHHLPERWAPVSGHPLIGLELRLGRRPPAERDHLAVTHEKPLRVTMGWRDYAWRRYGGLCARSQVYASVKRPPDPAVLPRGEDRPVVAAVVDVRAIAVTDL